MARTTAGTRQIAGSRTTATSRSTFPQNYTINSGTLFEDFETLADWTQGLGSGSPSGTTTAETTLVKTGTKSLRISATNGGVFNTKVISQIGTNFSVIGLWINVPDITNLNNINLYIGSTTNLSKNFSISIFKSKLRNGWNFIQIGRSEWTNTGSESWDNTMVRIRVRVDTLASQTCDVIFDSIYYGIYSRPKVLITFDDGWSTQYTKAYSYMATKGFKGTCYLIKDAVGTAGYMTTNQITELYNAGWDMGTHGLYDLTSLGNQSAMEADIQYNLSYLTSNNFIRNNCHLHYTYPQGVYNTTVIQALNGFITARTIITEDNSTVKGIDNKMLLRAKELRSDTVTLTTAKGYVDTCISRGDTLILFAHKIADSPGGYTEWPTSDFNSLIDYIYSKRNSLDVVTITEWYNGLGGKRTTV